jgi:hypothetical protein
MTAREDGDIYRYPVLAYSPCPRRTQSSQALDPSALSDFLKALEALEEATGRKHHPAPENRKGVDDHDDDDDKERPGKTHNDATNSPHHDSASSS